MRPELIVLHYTGMADCAGARARLCDPVAEVSAHWLIDANGGAEQLVDESLRAWHAGAGAWRGRDDVNSRSIGIELDNPGDRPFTAPQMLTLETVLRGIFDRWSIPKAGVIAHSDLAVGRKIDPGPRFDWRRLALMGLSVWPDAPGRNAPLAESLDAIGYPPADAAQRLAAFRLRFRPGARGAETETDRRIADAVARLPG
ncbi:N-acetylmuramoyl-L-alanine amidase [Paracoccus pacificus]|uniref:N-acetylmuramoyl-L-alanine amidase n=1 Tax=Paracoccus pacificus TaxID=1463598 RepID=A0ABW4R642_9RHOB